MKTLLIIGAIASFSAIILFSSFLSVEVYRHYKRHRKKKNKPNT